MQKVQGITENCDKDSIINATSSYQEVEVMEKDNEESGFLYPTLYKEFLLQFGLSSKVH